ncbi:hypothetical protein P7C73_g4026, partial [Tremellales sp. Uapishka_1]
MSALFNAKTAQRHSPEGNDVLLRHRRRCHPTPPPPDRSSHSPPPLRPHPSVPISSSRTAARDHSPVARGPRGRKHARPSSASPPAHDRSRPRVEDEAVEEEEEIYDSRSYLRQNGMGNGGVYGSASQYYPNPNNSMGESSTYTPHLLPMFQQSYGQVDDSTHNLEEAQMLLSMGGAVPQFQQEAVIDPMIDGQRVVPDWESQQTIQMMMDTADENTDPDSDGRGSGVLAIDPVVHDLGDNMIAANFLGSLGDMNWGKDGSSPGALADALGWAVESNSPSTSPRPISPFPLSLFSPSTFGLPHLTPNLTANSDADSNNEHNDAMRSILETLAMYDVPQSRNNPNPERPLLRVAHSDLYLRAGSPVSEKSRFYLPPDRFVGCYQIPHWTVPPLRSLSVMASKTFHTLLNHFSFVHLPTFRLIDTAACLAFAICTVGGVRMAHQKPGRKRTQVEMDETINKIIGPTVSCSWDPLIDANEEEGTPEDREAAENWQGGDAVRNEKTNMLVKSFSRAQGVLMTEYNVALLQALLLYHAPFFLSQDETERQEANFFLGTIINITRQIGFFTAETEHFETEITVPAAPYTPLELDIAWKRWIQLEGRRRTAYLVYQLDTVCALESSLPCLLTSCEIAYLPLPAPDTLWKAPTAEIWLEQVQKYRPMTLDEAMRRIFFLPTYGAFDSMHERADTKFYNLLNESEFGPFARVAMIVTLLRGIIDIGEGKRDRGDWRDLTDLWVGCSWLKPSGVCLGQDGRKLDPITANSLRARFEKGLELWRQGWDFDSLCPTPAKMVENGRLFEKNGTNKNLCERLNYCEEALPFYWLAQALLNILNQAPPNEPGWNQFAGLKYSEMLESARMFTRMGEGAAPGLI